MDLLVIFVGGGLGSAIRYSLSMLLNGNGWPWGTMAVNVAGSFLIGLLGALSGKLGWGNELRLFLTVGLCGGFTTFSTLSNECLSFVKDGAYASAAVYILLTIVLGLATVAAGWHLVR